MKQLIIIFTLLCCITSTSLCENCFEFRVESADPIFIENTKLNYIISASNEAITISSVVAGSQIWVFDSSGRNIYNKVAKGDYITVPIRTRGVFIIRIKADKDIFSTKVLIK